MNVVQTAYITIGLCFICLTGHTKETSNINRQIDATMATLPVPPKPGDEIVDKVCEYVGKHDQHYKRLLAQLSGADPAKDAPLVIIAKMRKMWDAYGDAFKCNGYLASNEKTLNINPITYYPYFTEDQPTINAIIAKLPPCPKPADYLLDNICECIKNGDIEYKTNLLKMASADPVNDPPLVVMAKVQRLWKAYYVLMTCTDKDLNILNYGVDRRFNLYFDGLIENYGLNINTPDPKDKKTVLDFTREQVSYYRQMAGQNNTVIELEKIYQHLKKLGAKHAAELKE